MNPRLTEYLAEVKKLGNLSLALNIYKCKMRDCAISLLFAIPLAILCALISLRLIPGQEIFLEITMVWFLLLALRDFRKARKTLVYLETEVPSGESPKEYLNRRNQELTSRFGYLRPAS